MKTKVTSILKRAVIAMCICLNINFVYATDNESLEVRNFVDFEVNHPANDMKTIERYSDKKQ